MVLKEVISRRDKNTFLNVARKIYKDDNTWVCPLNKEINSIFDPGFNSFYQHGTAIRWVLLSDKGELLGRIAAFIDYHLSEQQEQPTGGMGFFECIDDQDAACMLFDAARLWLGDNDMEAMDGPINFGERDKYWGLLVDGFTHPAYEIAYNPPYYQALFEGYGFKTYYKQEGFHLDLKKDLPERFRKISEWILKKPEYSFRHLKWNDLDTLVNDFAKVYNEAWAPLLKNFKPMQKEYIKKTLKKVKIILDPDFIWIAYYKDEPVAIYLMWPDVNMILKHLNGKLTWPSLLKFLYLKKRNTITRARGVLMGVIPRFQKHGLESGMALMVYNAMQRKPHYKEIEFSWVGDFNPHMRKMWLHIGSEPMKHYITYRYLFDRNKEFKRFPISK